MYLVMALLCNEYGKTCLGLAVLAFWFAWHMTYYILEIFYLDESFANCLILIVLYKE